MRNSPLLFLLLLLVACNTSKKDVSITSSPNYNQSLLWKIEAPGANRPSYLFGTIHLIPQDKFLFTSAMERAFSQSDEVMFEVDINDMKDMSKMMEMMQLAMMPGDTTLKDLLTVSEYEMVQKKLGDGMSLMMLERIKPLFLSALGMENMSEVKDNMKSYEFELATKADSSGKKVLGLETIEEQMSAIDKIPLTVQAKMLVESMQSKGNDEYNDLLKAYLAQDLDALNGLMGDQMDPALGYMDPLLKNRNYNWISRIQKQISAHPTFIAVGAGHLPGKDGVINLLRQNGIRVTPIR